MDHLREMLTGMALSGLASTHGDVDVIATRAIEIGRATAAKLEAERGAVDQEAAESRVPTPATKRR